jgi:hypothetical protein
MLNNLGDGSTLSIDFTTGVLDPRVTFTRSTNATFINYQGYVTVADANMFVNSAWTDANNTPTGWTLGTGTGSVSRSGETRTLTCTAQQYWWYQQPASRSGLTYSVSVEVTAVSGSMVYGDIILAGSSTYINWYKDGVLQATGTSTPVTTGVITLIFTANADNTILRLGLGSAGTNVTGSVTLRYPQFQLGQIPLRSYYENTSTSAARYNSARFDYDPTTLTPRGLLIEGSATNLALRSNDLNTTVVDGTQWTASGYTRGDVSTTLPDGTTGNACRISGSGSSSFRSAAITVLASTVYTFSFWARNNGGSQARYRVWNVTAGSSIVDYTLSGSNYVSQIGGANNTSTTWVRVSVTFTTPVGCTSIYVYPTSSDSGTVDVLFWGAQVEAGSASSYIPTGASTGNRAVDTAIIAAGTAFSGWYTGGLNGTFYADWYGGVAGASGTQRSVLATDDVTTKHLHLYQTATTNTMTLANFGGGSTLATSNAISPAGSRSKAAFSYATSAMNVCLNGGTVASGTVTGFSVSPTWLSLGAPSTNGTSITGTTVVLNNSIRSIKYWPTVLPNAQLQALTT